MPKDCHLRQSRPATDCSCSGGSRTGTRHHAGSCPVASNTAVPRHPRTAAGARPYTSTSASITSCRSVNSVATSESGASAASPASSTSLSRSARWNASSSFSAFTQHTSHLGGVEHLGFRGEMADLGRRQTSQELALVAKDFEPAQVTHEFVEVRQRWPRRLLLERIEQQRTTATTSPRLTSLSPPATLLFQEP